MKKLTNVPVVAGVVTVLLTQTSCAIDDQGSADAGDAEGQVVTVGTLRSQPHLYHPHFYDDYAPEGVEFEVVLFDTSPDIQSAVASGSVDFGLAGVPAAISGVAAGQDVVVVASAADGGSRFVGRDGLEDISDIEGLRVGYPMGSSQEVLLRLTLENEGIDPESDIELVNLPFADMAGALESESIDAFLSAEIGPSTALENGAVELGSPYETPVGQVNIGLLTTNELVESDPDLVGDVVDTHAQTSEFMTEETETWAEGLVDTFGLDQPVVDTAIGNIWPRSLIDSAYQAEVEALIEQMAELDQIETAPEVEDVVDPSFVED